MKLSKLSFYYTLIKSTAFHVGQHSKQLQNKMDTVSIYNSKKQVCVHTHMCVHMYGKQYIVSRYTTQTTYITFCIIHTCNENHVNVHIICFSFFCNAKPCSPLPIYTEYFILIPDPHEIHYMVTSIPLYLLLFLVTKIFHITLSLLV